MKGRQIKVEVLLGAVLALVVSGGAGMLVRPAQKPDQVLRARTGDVVWNHELHARMPEIASCTVCHHTERPGITRPKPCGDCHTLFSNREAVILADLFMEKEEKTYSGEQGPPAMEIFHNKCMGCHKAMSQGPVGCRDCHAQRFSGTQGIVEWDHRTHARKMEIDCVRCHHQDTEAAWDGEYRACGTCHKPAEILGQDPATGIADHEQAEHGKCHTCHTEYNPENDLRTCTDCHPGLVPFGEEEAPSLDVAVHNRCGECHNLAFRDLTPSMPIYCTDCHKPDPSLLRREGSAAVLWSHERHGNYTEWTCNTCHHTDVPGEPHLACRSCHDTPHFVGIPALEEALDRNCIGCHLEEGAGLTRWAALESDQADLLTHARFVMAGEDGTIGSAWWDHRFHAVSLALSCRECHHNTMQAEGKLLTAHLAQPGVPEEAGYLQACTNCHGDGGPAPGSPAEGSGAPPVREVYGRVCTECHKRLGGGPRTFEAFMEAQRMPLAEEKRSSEDE